MKIKDKALTAISAIRKASPYAPWDLVRKGFVALVMIAIIWPNFTLVMLATRYPEDAKTLPVSDLIFFLTSRYTIIIVGFVWTMWALMTACDFLFPPKHRRRATAALPSDEN